MLRHAANRSKVCSKHDMLSRTTESYGRMKPIFSAWSRFTEHSEWFRALSTALAMETKLNHGHDVIYSCCMIHPGTNSWSGCASFSEIHASQILLDLLQSRFGQIHQFLQGCSPPKASPHMKKLSRNQIFNHLP